MKVSHIAMKSSIKDKILAAQEEAYDESARLQKGLDEMIKRRSDRALYYLDRIWVPLKGDVRTLIMDESYKSKYYVHPGADKMYYNLRDRSSGLLQQPEILEWKSEGIAMDFITKLLMTSSGHDTIWVIVDQLIKSAYLFLGTEEGKLAPMFVRPFEITERIGPVAYRLRLPKELNGIHDMFHVLNLKKCLVDPILQVPLDEPVEILESSKSLSGVELPSSRFGRIQNVDLNSRGNQKTR
nr:putative reverse transcriptase domain-containing protein [Tanacetum cinerariifolium]